MKSRQKFTVSEKSILKRSESEDYRLPRKKNSSNPLLQKNLNFLRTYNNLLRKPIFQQVGDADSYFKTTLRNESLDLIRDLHLDTQIVRTVRSFESINKRKFRSKYTLPSPNASVGRTVSFQPIPEGKKEEFRQLFASATNRESDSETESETKENLLSRSEYLEPTEPPVEKESTTHAEDFHAEQTTVKMAEETDADEVLPEGDDEEGENFTTDMETEDEEMKEVQKMIDDASEELQQVVKENEKIIDQLEDGKEAEEGDSVFKFDPTIDSAVLKELEDAERQAKETAAIITELRNRVGDLLKKEKMTEAEALELEEKNKQLKTQMVLFEEKIKRIQFLIAQTNLFDKMAPVGPPLQTKHDEDVLPKVIVCGLTENNIPKIIVCNDNKKSKKSSKKSSPVSPRSARSEFSKKLDECICMQERLANENANLEGQRYQLQSDLINQDQTVDSLQRQLTNLHTEMRMVCQENASLNERLQEACSVPCGGGSPPSPKKKGCGKDRGPCPADVVARLEEYSQNTQMLERQLGDMEEEVRYMQKELIAVQKEREHLEHHRKMFCPPPNGPVPACLMPPLCKVPPCAMPPCALPPCGDGNKAEQQLRELKEKYSRLQDDFKNKVTEVAGLRTDNEKLKDIAIKAEEVKKIAEDKIKELEIEMKKLKLMTKGSSKEQMIELEQQLNVAKQRFREAQDELEELRALVEDQKAQMDDYRNKYLEAQQNVEEQRRHIDMMEMENQRVSEQVNLEIQRVKNQFQEKLQELMPLPDILKSTQLKLQEAQQMHLLAERNNEAIARELQMYKDKIAAMTNQMDEVRSDQQLGADEKATLEQRIDDLEKLLQESEELNNSLKTQLEQMTEKADEFETLAEERLHEITQLESQLESVREESARQIARVKERCEIVRKSMQNQISDLERQMAQSKAIAKAAQRDRDEIRQKMQAQINNLNENFEDAQMRIRSLQGHVNFMKNTYGNVYPKEDTTPKLPDPCNCGAEY